jgi:hypothetical protein
MNGKVVDREYQKEDTTTTLVYYGDTLGWLPQTNYYPAKWKLRIETKEGKKVWVDVDKKTYDKTSVGDNWNRN